MVRASLRYTRLLAGQSLFACGAALLLNRQLTKLGGESKTPLCSSLKRTKKKKNWFHLLVNTYYTGCLPLRACTSEVYASHQSCNTKNIHQWHAWFGALLYVTRLHIFTARIVYHNLSEKSSISEKAYKPSLCCIIFSCFVTDTIARCRPQ